jgi:WD40 repeat protein
MSTRRQFLLLAGSSAFAWLAGRKRAHATDATLISWPSRAVELPNDEESQKPPVVTAVRLHKGGKWLATAGDDHLVRIWALDDGKLVHRLNRHTDWVRSIDFSPDGERLASAGTDRQIILWGAATGEFQSILATHQQAIVAIRFSNDGKRLAAVGFESRIKIYDVASRQLVAEPEAPCQDMRAVAFAPDDALLAVGGRCGTIRLIAPATGEVVRDISAHRQRVRALSFSDDGSYLASAGEDRTVHVLPISRGATGFALPTRPAKALALVFYGPRQLAVAGSDNLIRLWDVSEQREIGNLAGHSGTIAALDCQGKTLISAGYDTTVRIWTIADHIAGAEALPPRVGRPPTIDGVPRSR